MTTKDEAERLAKLQENNDYSEPLTTAALLRSQAAEIERLTGILTMNEMAYNNNKFVLDQEVAANEALRTANAKLVQDLDAVHDVLLDIGHKAHDASTGPAVPDVLWEIRAMAYDAIKQGEQ